MLRLRWVGVLALVTGVAWAVPGKAQVIVRAPFVSVVVGGRCRPGRGVAVQVPGVVDVRVGHGGPILTMPPPAGAPAPVVQPVAAADAPPPAEELPAPRPVPVPATPPASAQSPTPPPPPTPYPAAGQPMTLSEFATGFQPLPGPHQVLLIHPGTGQPVPVQFTLPGGRPRRIHVSRRELAFDYGGQEVVVVRFGLRGRVRVSYR